MRNKFVLLASNYYGYRVDLTGLYFPADTGYPDFLAPSKKSKWTLELYDGGLFDALQPNERFNIKQWHQQVKFIIYNQTIPNSFVSIFDAKSAHPNLTLLLAKQFQITEYELKRKQLFSFRRLAPDKPEEEFYFTEHSSSLPPVCVSTSRPSIGYAVAFSKNNSVCFRQVELLDGTGGLYGKRHPNCLTWVRLFKYQVPMTNPFNCTEFITRETPTFPAVATTPSNVDFTSTIYSLR